MAVAELDGRPVVVSGAGDRTVRVWDLATGAPVGDPFTGHTGGVRAVAVAELDGRPVVVSGADDSTVRVTRLMGRRRKARCFTRHSSAVTAVVVAELDGRPVVVSTSQAGMLDVRDLASRTKCGGTVGSPSSVIAAACLHKDLLVVASTRMITVRDLRSVDPPLLAIELDSDIAAVTTHGETVIAATDLGLVALDVPPLRRPTPPAKATHPVRTWRRRWRIPRWV